MPLANDNKFYYIAGSDFFQEEQLKKLLEPIEDCETENFAPDEFSAEFFYSFINSPSLFQENKAAVVKSAEKIKGIGDILSKCKGCMETNLFFMAHETKLSKEISAGIKEAGFETLAEKKAKKYDLTGQIMQMFADAEFRIDTSSALEINEIFTGDLKQISNEIEKLKMFFAYKKPQSSADIMNAITARKQDNIFTFIDAYTARKRNTCLSLFNGFITNDENLNILVNLLFRRMKELYLYINIKEEVKEKRPWMLEKIKVGAQVWKREDLIRLFDLYAKLDYQNKTGQISIENYMTNLISAL